MCYPFCKGQRKFYKNLRRERGQMQERTYIAIDLKSFYASVECMDRGWIP